MLRRFNRSGASARAAPCAAGSSSASALAIVAPVAAPRQTAQKAEFLETLAACPLVGHAASITAISSSNLLFSPLGTVALCAMAYNFNYVGLKHLWYTAEFPIRDYVQDVALKQALRYLMLISLLLTANGLFCEP